MARITVNIGIEQRFPFRHGDLIQHVSGTGPTFVVRLVDDSINEAYAEACWFNPGPGTRVINTENWKKVANPEEPLERFEKELREHLTNEGGGI
jgi:hypothetical protein